MTSFLSSKVGLAVAEGGGRSLPWETLLCLAAKSESPRDTNKIGLVTQLRAKLVELGISKQLPAGHCILHKHALSIEPLPLKGAKDRLSQPPTFKNTEPPTVRLSSSLSLGKVQGKSPEPLKSISVSESIKS